MGSLKYANRSFSYLCIRIHKLVRLSLSGIFQFFFIVFLSPKEHLMPSFAPILRKRKSKKQRWIYSCLQALSQCEMTLNKLGVVKVNADDTARAAQVMHAVFL